jgi:site-specific DNA recombinase
MCRPKSDEWYRKGVNFMAKITKITASIPEIKPKKKVAAYARVSRDGERLLHSFSAQVSYYSALIQKNPDWEYAGVYSDEAITGTRIDVRDGFQKMLEDCEAGKIDIILTKSVSRFARNTVDLLNTVRHLKDIGVEVRFEEQNISTFSGDGELMLTILASFAQEEVTSTSQNIKWAKRKQAENGIMTNTSVPYGYRCEDRTPMIIPEQAAIVQRIFKEYISGKMLLDIAADLNAEGIETQREGKWTATTLQRMLSNPNYTGNMVLGKWYTKDPLKHDKAKNTGEQDMFLVENSHEAIIDQETFDQAQKELKRRSDLGKFTSPKITWTEFSGKIICECCGLPFGRQTNKMRGGLKVPAWACKKPGGKCPTPRILESELQEISKEILDLDEYSQEAFIDQVDHLSVSDKDIITFYLKNGEARTWHFERRKGSPLQTRRKDTIALAGKIICGNCGEAYRYRSQKSDKPGGGRIGYWRCKNFNSCKGLSLRDDDLKNLIAEVMSTPEYDENAFTKAIDRITVDGQDLRFLFHDGHEEIREWNPPKHKGVKWTDERRQKAKESGAYKRQWTPERRQEMSEAMKQIRRSKKW